MKKVIFLGIVGLAAGYLIFGRAGGELIPIIDLINPPQNILEEVGQAVKGLDRIRRNILISGAVGAGLGLVITLVNK